MSIMFDKKRPNAIHAILGGDGPKEGESSPDSELHECAQELIDAIHAKSVPEAVSAFKAMFACLESQPHEEYGED